MPAVIERTTQIILTQKIQRVFMSYDLHTQDEQMKEYDKTKHLSFCSSTLHKIMKGKPVRDKTIKVIMQKLNLELDKKHYQDTKEIRIKGYE